MKNNVVVDKAEGRIHRKAKQNGGCVSLIHPTNYETTDPIRGRRVDARSDPPYELQPYSDGRPSEFCRVDK
uniref:Uncharacterized protein n=1 Tax=Candidatus Kentrum sp. UNK TaxID=2126344 RepID=A0A451AUR8_9GAMM|nr:MAG: hypothetical protein BECKUNK1418G_GA0071005_107213 [Candidatus Kentron sp. UNK]VFK69637.1 MAG: hypothetical protein BECKUNK1418H_GA0071006_101713 [Candidatus Kentron sp. UNK]